ncbi:hypothetical protein HDU83_006041 [Entophlyctis luteolus]|nr:hypothetical protein HDU82_006067 [Entophlyctis luteolus]KAJ3342610.1 hypothetical protein HDU83_006041 [Entophlyctis luteolus]KAJ3380661.1 hypothetical protein HDU84_005662 [Entophlyctis sp. JEL0112]
MRSFALLALVSAILNGVSAQSVLTPKGPIAVGSAIHVADGASIVTEANVTKVIAANGTVLHTASHNNTGLPSNSNSTLSRRAFKSGWVADATWYNTLGSPIDYFTSTWSVPPVPETYHTQTVFIFNSIEPAAFNAILQPVLQYGPSAAGGGEYWAVANWYLDPSGTYFTTPVQVSVGQELTGIMELVSVSGSSYSYQSYFSGVGSVLSATGAQLVWATETLEVYNIQAATDYPAGSTYIYDINLRLQNNANPAVTWGTSSDAADNVVATVITQGSSGAEVELHYPDSLTYTCAPGLSNGFAFSGEPYYTYTLSGVALSCIPQGTTMPACYAFPQGNYWLAMQDDGNLVQYTNGISDPGWNTQTGGEAPGQYYFAFQGDGNAVVYTPANVALWATGTNNQGITGGNFCLQGDGNVVLYDSNWSARWAYF